MTDIPEQVDAELRVLREQFALRLPARLAELEAAGQAARAAGWAAEPLRDFYRLAHSLSGAAATFGFPAVGDAAARLESLLQQALAAGAPPGEETAQGIDVLMEELRSHVPPPAAPPREGPPQDGRGNR